LFVSQAEILTGAQLLESFTSYAPRILLAFIILMVGWVIGRVIGALIGRAVARLGADSGFRRTSVGRAILRAGFTASDFSKTVAKWIVYIVAILIALESLAIPSISQAVEMFLTYVPDFVGALAIFIIGLILSDWAGESIKKSFALDQSQSPYLSMIGDGAKVILYFITLTIVLSQLRVDVTIIYIIAQAFAWSVAIAVGVASGLVAGWVLKDRIKEWLEAKK